MTTICNKSGRYSEGERNRQKALDYIIANPGCVGMSITAAMGWRNDVTLPRLTRMTVDGDVTRELTQYSYRNETGGAVNITTYAYTALREKTRPAESMRELMISTMQGTKRAQALVTIRAGSEPWLTRNIDPDRKPISHQGGQGSLPRQVYIGSVMA